jgi:tetratricopeptide (TPR) repeat protein
LLAGGLLAQGAWSQPETSTVSNSPLDGELFYQLLVGELQLRDGEAGVAYQIMLDAAQRRRSEDLFRRSIDIAIGARAGEQALAATRSWRQALPRSRVAAEMQVQILVALGRSSEAAEPLRSLIELTPAADRPGVIAVLPRLVSLHGQTSDSSAARTSATMIDDVLKTWREQPATRTAALVATGQAWLAGGNAGRALELVRQAQRTDAGHEAAAMLALDLMAVQPEAEAAVKTYLQAQPKGALVRLAYARRLTTTHRYAQALSVVEDATRSSPEVPTAWLMQGALQIELGHNEQAQASLERYLALKKDTPAATTEPAASEEDDSDAEPLDGASATQPDQELLQAYLMLAQVAEQRKDYAAAQGWLDKMGESQNVSAIVQRRASLLARQGQLTEARTLLQRLPERTPEELRSKVLAEVQLLREAQQWRSAYDLLEQSAARLPDDPDLLYEQALLAEHLEKFDDMERLLQRVIKLKPDQQHAYNALGYSLADRNQRLDEARRLIGKAIELAPGDPFITDSLGWVEFRLGRFDEAVRLLRSAYAQRPDTEIGVHLGEVLWSQGQRDEALTLWRTGQSHDPDNQVLKSTLQRLGVKL